MSFLKNVGDKAKEAASAAASKSQDMVEIGKLKKKISNLEDVIADSKMKIGEMAFTAHKDGVDLPMDEVEGILAEIDEKLEAIKGLKKDIENVKLDKEPEE